MDRSSRFHPTPSSSVSGLKGRALTAAQTRQLDRVLTHPLWGLLILIGILGAALYLTYAVALPASGWLYTAVVVSLSAVHDSLLRQAPEWLSIIFVHGVVAGVGTVLSLVPILLVFFSILGLLEESRYMLRASRVTDRYLQWLGLPGKACIPLSMGFGCTTTAVLGCRILEERRSRLLTMLLVPFVPCTSRMAVIALLATPFFGRQAMLVTWGLISINLIILALVGFSVNRLKPSTRQPSSKRSSAPLALPPYQMPRGRAVLRFIRRNIMDFLGKTPSLVIFSAAAWALSYFPNGRIETSYLASFGRAVIPAGRVAGLEDWRLIVALLASLAAKENAIAVLGVLYPPTLGASGLSTQLTALLTPAARLSFLVIQMLFIPCANTLMAMRQESGSWKMTIIEIVLTLCLSLAAGALVYQVGSLI
jgi:ferrous iron transport protein B